MGVIEWTLVWSAMGIGVTHTLAGPDHYIPFIGLSKARNWSTARTMWLTGISGIGHVLSSIIISIAFVYLGRSLNATEIFEASRGEIAGYAMTILGLSYLIFGIYRAITRKPHKHIHLHKDGSTHLHEHVHEEGHDHVHNKKVTPWLLFLVFVLGPCEFIIPILFEPLAESNTISIVSVSLAFLISTVGTMLITVYLLSKGFKMIKMGWMERWLHVIAGSLVFLSGLAIVFGL